MDTSRSLEQIRMEREERRVNREKEDYHHLELFKLGIKPGALVRMGLYRVRAYLGNDTKYCIYSLKTGTLVTNKPIRRSELEHYDLGILMGYPEKACKAYVEIEDHSCMSFIDFGGILFNTTGVEEYSLKWCEDNYLPLMLEHFGEVKCKTFNLINGKYQNEIECTYLKDQLACTA